MKKNVNKNEELFKKEVDRLVKYFGLLNWDKYFKVIKNDNYQALCVADRNDDDSLSARSACFEICTPWIHTDGMDPDEIYSTAFHEVIELLLIPLREIMNNPQRYASQIEIDTEIHNVINILMNTIYKDFLQPKVKKKNLKLKKVRGE